jgi:two-component system phosphate regulon sensor histidine kinase PhoR
VHHVRSGKTLQAAARGLDAADERIGVLVLRDLTELRRLESVRRDFVANVSHELRTPLTSIRALVETLEAGAINDPEVSGDFLHRIISEVERLTTLVDELLDLARLESGRTSLRLTYESPGDLVVQAANRLSPQTERAGLTISWDIASNVTLIRCDQERIGQVLLNLIHNAIKFTPTGGSIHLAAVEVGTDIEFRVEDTGIGVLPVDIPRLFERFYKTDRARRSVGTGLGLAIAKHIVLAHGGTIWAEHNRPSGTVFIFRLPVDGPDESVTTSETEPRLGESAA